MLITYKEKSYQLRQGYHASGRPMLKLIGDDICPITMDISTEHLSKWFAVLDNERYPDIYEALLNKKIVSPCTGTITPSYGQIVRILEIPGEESCESCGS